MTQSRTQVTMGRRTHLVTPIAAAMPILTLQVRPIVPLRYYAAAGVLMHTKRNHWGDRVPNMVQALREYIHG